MKGNMLIAQSGGPTAAVNASLAGAVLRALECPEIETVYGARNGVQGALKEDFVDLGARLADPLQAGLLRRTPAMALGSCRKRLGENDPRELERLRDIFRAHNIRWFFYIGGNDSMDTVLKLSRYFRETGEDVKVLGIPKTIDNDIACTDHTPGFGSAARFIANSVAEIACDSEIYDLSSVTLVEIMGRNAGWLTAASALARRPGWDAPHIICMPEVPFDNESFLSRVAELRRSRQHLIIAVSEGVRYPGGDYVASAGNLDPFGHRQLAGAARRLGFMVLERFGCKVRAVELNVLQRAAGTLSSDTDLREAEAAGAKAVELALAGKTGVMVTFLRESEEPYRLRLDCADVERVANVEKTVPLELIDAKNMDVTEEMLRYLRPLAACDGDGTSCVPAYFQL